MMLCTDVLCLQDIASKMVAVLELGDRGGSTYLKVVCRVTAVIDHFDTQSLLKSSKLACNLVHSS